MNETDKRPIKLHKNENPLGPSPRVISLLRERIPQISLYPDVEGNKLKETLASYYNINANQITLGHGSSHVLFLIAQVFGGHNIEIMFPQYSFIMHPIVTKLVGSSPLVVPALNYKKDLVAMAQAVTPKTKVIFLANPSNPTADTVSHQEFEQFLKQVPPQTIVVADEAYYEYAVDDDYPNTLLLQTKFPNLIIVRTFSKTWGIAGLRAGYAISNQEIALRMKQHQIPYTCNFLAQEAAMISLSDKGHMERALENNTNGLKQLVAGLMELNLEFLSSKANFITINFQNAAQMIFDKLLEKNIFLAQLNNYNMPNFLRVSVGSPEDNKQFLVSLAEILAKTNFK